MTQDATANPGHHAQGQGRQHHDDNGRVGPLSRDLGRTFSLKSGRRCWSSQFTRWVVSLLVVHIIARHLAWYARTSVRLILVPGIRLEESAQWVATMEVAMITGMHAVVYTRNAEADRAFFRDVLGFSS